MIGSGATKLMGQGVESLGSLMFKKLSGEAEHLGKVIRRQAPDFTKAIAKEVDQYPPAAETFTNLYRNGEWDEITKRGQELMENGKVKEAQEEMGGVVKMNSPAPAVVPEKPYNLSEGVEDFMGDMDVAAGRSWQQPGGELDVELEKLLTIGRGKNAKTLSYEELVERAKTSKTDKTRLDYYNSLLATGPAQNADDILHYGFAEKPRAKTSQMEGSPEYSPQLHKSKEFHHKGMKSIQFGIFNRARQLVSEGKATTDDLLNLHALSNSMGAPSGSRKSAAEFMERFGHDIMHKQITLKKGIQPSGTREALGGFRTKPKDMSVKKWTPIKDAASNLSKELNEEINITRFDLDYIKRQGEPLEKAIAKWKVFRKSKMYSALAPDGESEITRLLKRTENMSIAELTQFQKEVLEDITLPMQKEAVLMEEVMERLTPAQIFELQNTKNWQEVLNQRRTLKDQKSAVAGAKEDKALRKQMNTAFN